MVLASLGSARDNARDAKVKATLSAMRAQAELQYDGDYDDVCNDTSVSGQMYREARLEGDISSLIHSCHDGNQVFYWPVNATTPSEVNNIAPDANQNFWVAQVRLHSGVWFCVDSSGTTKEDVNSMVSNNNDRTC